MVVIDWDEQNGGGKIVTQNQKPENEVWVRIYFKNMFGDFKKCQNQSLKLKKFNVTKETFTLYKLVIQFNEK